MTLLQQALEALQNTINCLMRENEKNDGPICDTIWYDDHITLFDYINSEIAALRAQPACQYLANGTRFKLSIDDDGKVACFWDKQELDGRWVALVAAEDDCHLRAQPTILKGMPAMHPINDGFTFTASYEPIPPPQPAPPECKTEAEKTAYAFGWWKALESVRAQPDHSELARELRYVADWAQHHLDKAQIINAAADALEGL